jgi:hypothetical protein
MDSSLLETFNMPTDLTVTDSSLELSSEAVQDIRFALPPDTKNEVGKVIRSV